VILELFSSLFLYKYNEQVQRTGTTGKEMPPDVLPSITVQLSPPPLSSIYYLRIGVPKPLRSAVKKIVIKQSLRTKDFAVAKQRFSVAYAESMAYLQQHSFQL